MVLENLDDGLIVTPTLDRSLLLGGNAAAGVLREIFSLDFRCAVYLHLAQA
jgi:hypothetical protein